MRVFVYGTPWGAHAGLPVLRRTGSPTQRQRPSTNGRHECTNGVRRRGLSGDMHRSGRQPLRKPMRIAHTDARIRLFEVHSWTAGSMRLPSTNAARHECTNGVRRRGLSGDMHQSGRGRLRKPMRIARKDARIRLFEVHSWTAGSMRLPSTNAARHECTNRVRQRRMKTWLARSETGQSGCLWGARVGLPVLRRTGSPGTPPPPDRIPASLSFNTSVCDAWSHSYQRERHP
jgi:hypothetical protein